MHLICHASECKDVKTFLCMSFGGGGQRHSFTGREVIDRLGRAVTDIERIDSLVSHFEQFGDSLCLGLGQTRSVDSGSFKRLGCHIVEKIGLFAVGNISETYNFRTVGCEIPCTTLFAEEVTDNAAYLVDTSGCDAVGISKFKLFHCAAVSRNDQVISA